MFSFIIRILKKIKNTFLDCVKSDSEINTEIKELESLKIELPKLVDKEIDKEIDKGTITNKSTIDKIRKTVLNKYQTMIDDRLSLLKSLI